MAGLAGISLGVRLPNSGPFATAENILATAEHVERAGYDRVWVHDHISWSREKLTHFATGSLEACRDQDPNFFESVTTVGVLGGRLRRVGLGIAGLVLPLRDPRILAKQLTTIEHLVGSRLVLAFGIGAIQNDFDVMGVRFDRRGRLSTDHLAALRTIFSDAQPNAFESKSVAWQGGTFFPRPRRLPLWVTGASDAGLERAVRHADGWMTVYAPVEEYAEDIRRLRAAAERAERDPATIDTGIETYVTVARTHEDAVRIAKASLVEKFKTLEAGLEKCVVGDADEVLARLARYRDAGGKHAELKFVCHDPGQLGEMIDRVASAAYARG
ncbi:MAG TPA: LLM class flavin-dependent oxidoreductase [Candidatus Limnocylindria bacterium]|nr:LLM class flavin-dependent oxidoreductase [Candidatus Limnocylindria bacterium]